MTSKTEAQCPKIDEPYHELFLPLCDVYDEGGPEVFKHFERKDGSGRNAILIPMAYIDTLAELTNEENSVGASDALKFIRDHMKEQIFSSKDFYLYRVSDGLDICILDRSSRSNQNFPMESLERKVQETFAHPGKGKITLVTDQTDLQIKYKGRGFHVEEPKFLIVNEDIVREGIIMGNDILLNQLYANGNTIGLDIAKELLERDQLYLNQFVKFRGAKHEVFAVVKGKVQKNQAGTRIIGVENPVLQLLPEKENEKKLHYGDRRDPNHYITDNILGIKPLDMEQYLALQYGMISADVSVFFLCGKQGSGKTLLSFAHALDSVMIYDKEARERRGLRGDKKEAFYRQTILLKPPEILGGKSREQGFLPGDLYMKLKPHLRPFKDAFRETLLYSDMRFEDLFLHPKFSNDFGPPKPKEVTGKKINGVGHFSTKDEIVELVYSGFIGGSSIRDTLIVIDEAQDFRPYEMKTIIERTGEGTSLIILGDPVQVRNPKCSVKKNGLTFAIKHYLPKPYSGLVYLPRNFRSQASEDSEEMRVYNSE